MTDGRGEEPSCAFLVLSSAMHPCQSHSDAYAFSPPSQRTLTFLSFLSASCNSLQHPVTGIIDNFVFKLFIIFVQTMRVSPAGIPYPPALTGQALRLFACVLLPTLYFTPPPQPTPMRPSVPRPALCSAGEVCIRLDAARLRFRTTGDAFAYAPANVTS